MEDVLGVKDVLRVELLLSDEIVVAVWQRAGPLARVGSGKLQTKGGHSAVTVVD